MAVEFDGLDSVNLESLGFKVLCLIAVLIPNAIWDRVVWVSLPVVEVGASSNLPEQLLMYRMTSYHTSLYASVYMDVWLRIHITKVVFLKAIYLWYDALYVPSTK